MQKMPNLHDVFLSIMASFIGFGLVLGIAQAAFDFGGGRSLLLSSPVFAAVLAADPVKTPAGVILPLEPCPAGQVFYSGVVGGSNGGCRTGSCPTGYTATLYPNPAAGSVLLYCKINSGGVPNGVTSCPKGQVLKFSPNYAAGTGYCVAADVVSGIVVSNTCPTGYERTPSLWTAEIKAVCSTAAEKLKLLDSQCIVNAVGKRDEAIIAGMDSYAATLRNLVVVRERDLKNAWLQLSDRKARRTEITRIWNKYRLDVKYMQRQSSSLKTNAWKQFTIDRKSCGVYAAADDYTSIGTDNAIQMFPIAN